MSAPAYTLPTNRHKPKCTIYASHMEPGRLLHPVVLPSFKLKIRPNGALGAVAQTISYEVTLAIILLSVLLLNGSFTLSTLIITQEHL